MDLLIFYLLSVIACAISIYIDVKRKRIEITPVVKKEIAVVVFTPVLNTLVAVAFVLESLNIL